MARALKGVVVPTGDQGGCPTGGGGGASESGDGRRVGPVVPGGGRRGGGPPWGRSRSLPACRIRARTGRCPAVRVGNRQHERPGVRRSRCGWGGRPTR